MLSHVPFPWPTYLLLDDRFVREVTDHPPFQLLRRCQITMCGYVLEVHVRVGGHLRCPSINKVARGGVLNRE